jgi:SAM-dependent methyltransferase
VLDPEVATHYELGLEESRLFSGGRPRLEYLRTLELLDRALPLPPGRILDVGGATGAYAVPLCERGYSVHLIDPVAQHVERASQIALERALPQLTAAVGDARNLADAGDGYDATLLLGPLYHLISHEDRLRAFREAIRVTVPGGVVVAAAISRYASLINGLTAGVLDDPTFRGIVEGDLRDGQHRNPDVRGRPDFFTTAYFHTPDELVEEASAAGLLEVRLLGIEGVGGIVDRVDDIESQLFAARATESEPALIGASLHLMVIGRTATQLP